jgi:hypothetical protein
MFCEVTNRMSFSSNVVALIVFVIIISFNVASVSPRAYALISFGQSDQEGHIKQYCEHAGGMYQDIDSHYACTFIDHVK